jgi:hypothetical protein
MAAFIAKQMIGSKLDSVKGRFEYFYLKKNKKKQDKCCKS